MKKIIPLFMASLLSLSANAADIIGVGSTDISNPYKWSSTSGGQPWVNNVLPSTNDRFVWAGGVGRTKIADGYILVDGAFSFGSSGAAIGIVTSGSNGNGSALHLLFDDATATGGVSSLTTSMLSWNGTVYGNIYYFEGLNASSTGTMTFTASQSWGFSATGGNARKIIVGKGITFNATNTMTMAGTGNSSYEGFVVNGTANIGSLGKALTMSDGMHMHVTSTGKLNLEGGVTLISSTSTRDTAAKITLDSSGNSIGGYTLMAQSTSININASNDLETIILARGSDLLINVSSGTTELNGLLVAEMAAQRIININVADGAVLIFNTLNGVSYNNGEKTFSALGSNEEFASYQDLIFTAFGERRVLVRDNAGSEYFLARMSISGSSDTLYLSDYDSTAGGFWLTTSAIPEPAEWAAIFGAAALAFAFRRRFRK